MYKLGRVASMYSSNQKLIFDDFCLSETDVIIQLHLSRASFIDGSFNFTSHLETLNQRGG